MKPRKTIFTTSPHTAAQFIRNNDTAAFPTETVYGLGANVFSEQALEQIFTAKGRPADNPLIVHIASIDQIPLLTPKLPKSAEAIIARFFPGPITVIVPKKKDISPLVSAGLPTIGIRMPRHALAHRFLDACGVPVAAPSANLSGTPSPTSWQSVRDDLAGRIGCILKGKTTDVGLESTVVDCTGRRPVVLRTGAVTLEALQEVIPSTVLYTRRKADAPVKSPGMKYRHYSPGARVVLASRTDPVPEHAGTCAWIGINEPVHTTEFTRIRRCDTVDEYARVVFSFFRECDKKNIRTIYCEAVAQEGMGRALMDRIGRAAHA